MICNLHKSNAKKKKNKTTTVLKTISSKACGCQTVLINHLLITVKSFQFRHNNTRHQEMGQKCCKIPLFTFKVKLQFILCN